MSNRKIIASVHSVGEAQVIQSALQSTGIESAIDNAMMSTLFPHQTLAMGGVTVSIWEKDIPHAM
jgi:hypothetical protein